MLFRSALNSETTSSGCREKSLKISEAFSSSSLMSLQMNYMQDSSEIYAYSQAQWNNSPNQEVTSQVLKVVRASKLFKNTQSAKSRSRSNLILETHIEDFMQYFNKDLTASHSSVSMNVTLIDAKTSSVIASKTFTSKKDAQTLDASGGVQGLDSALEDVLVQSIEFLNEVCK